MSEASRPSRAAPEGRGEVVYRGRRVFDAENNTAEVVVTVTDDAGTRPLPWRLDLRNHSPTGPEWGYAGSGPAQLALAVLADLLGDGEAALSRYQRFKFAVIARLPYRGWELTGGEVRRVLKGIDAMRE